MVVEKDDSKPCAQGMRRAGWAGNIIHPATQPLSSGVADENYSAEEAMTRRPCRTDNTLSSQPETPCAHGEAPRKRRRSKTSTGPKAPIPRRRSSVHVRRNGQDLISFHRQSCRLFQSLGGTLAATHEWPSMTNRSGPGYDSNLGTTPSSCVIKTENGFAYLTSTTTMPHFRPANERRRNPSLISSTPAPFYDSAATTNTSSLTSIADPPSSTIYAKTTYPSASSSDKPNDRPHPISTLSWTSMESRRAEYAEIDRSHRGLLGLCRRLTPRWCQSGCGRKGFFEDGKDGETESVRRYRMAVNDDDDDENDDDDYDGFHGKEYMGCRSLLAGVTKQQRTTWWKWSCLSQP